MIKSITKNTEPPAEFNLLSVMEIIHKYMKQILIFVVASVLMSLIVGFFLPKKYYASATIYPTNPQLGDRNRLFNKNIEALYSIYGNSDDLDRLYTMSRTNAMFSFIADSFKLTPQNKAGSPDPERDKITARLKKNIEIKKTANGELVIGTWSRDSKLSAAISNAIVSRLETLHKQIVSDIEKNALNALNKKETNNVLDSIQQIDPARKATLDELMIGAEATPPPFIILDKAVPPGKAAKPNLLLIMISTLLASLIFAILFSLLFERSKNKALADRPLYT